MKRKIKALCFSESESVSCLVLSDSLQPHGLQLVRLLCPWDSPSKNTDVGCHSLLHGCPLEGGEKYSGSLWWSPLKMMESLVEMVAWIPKETTNHLSLTVSCGGTRSQFSNGGGSNRVSPKLAAFHWAMWAWAKTSGNGTQKY